MRSWLVLAVLALLVGAADAGPKGKKRRGTFAKYIESTAPDDPPRPWVELPTWLDVAFVIDRAAWADDEQLESVRKIVQHISSALDDSDQVAILAFDTKIEKTLRGCHVDRQRRAVEKALARITRSATSDVATALAEAHAFVERGPDRHVIVFFTGGEEVDERLESILRAIRHSNVKLFVVGLRGASWPSLRRMANIAGGLWFAVGDDPDADMYFDAGDQIDLVRVLDDLHHFQ